MKLTNIIKPLATLCLALLLTSALSGGKSGMAEASLWQKASKAMEDYDYDAAMLYSALILQDSKASEHDKTYATFYIGASKLFTGRGKESGKTLQEALAQARRIGNDSVVSLALNSLGIWQATVWSNLFVAQQYFLESLDYAHRCRFEAQVGVVCGNLAEVAENQHDTGGLRYAQEAHRIGLKLRNAHIIYNGAYHTARLFFMSGQWQKASRHLKEAMTIFKHEHYKDATPLYLLAGQISAAEGERSKAGQYLTLAVAKGRAEKSPSLPEVLYELGRLSYEGGNMERAETLLEEAKQACAQLAVYTSSYKIYTLLADISFKKGRTAEAYAYLKQAKDSLESMNNLDRNHQINERKIVMAMMEKEKEAARHEQQLVGQRHVSIALALVLVLTVAMLVLVGYFYKKRTLIYKNIVRQNKESLRTQDQLQERVRQLTEQLSGKRVATGIIDEEKSQELYDKVCLLMKDQKLYRDRQLSRDSLAEMLGTNHTYLSKVINEKAGMNFSQFVNSYRLNEALRLLSDKSRSTDSMKVLAQELGYSSVSTFYKLFRNRVGMSPIAFRESVNDLQENTEA